MFIFSAGLLCRMQAYLLLLSLASTLPLQQQEVIGVSENVLKGQTTASHFANRSSFLVHFYEYEQMGISTKSLNMTEDWNRPR
jgi:hypothetical protein